MVIETLNSLFKFKSDQRPKIIQELDGNVYMI